MSADCHNMVFGTRRCFSPRIQGLETDKALGIQMLLWGSTERVAFCEEDIQRLVQGPIEAWTRLA